MMLPSGRKIFREEKSDEENDFFRDGLGGELVVSMMVLLTSYLWAADSPGIPASDLQITLNGSQPSAKAPAEYFTGNVRLDPLFQAKAPARAFGASVTFEPGARTAWHTHPLGQTLIVTAGCGLVQRWGGPIVEVRPSDVVWFPPNQKHWHGATATTAMSNIAIQEQLDGKAVEWLEQVSDEQYKR